MGGAAIDPIVLLYGDLERAQGLDPGIHRGTIQIVYVLHRSLAKGRFASNDHRTSIVLKSGRTDLRSTGAEFIDHDDQWTIISDIRIRIAQNLFSPIRGLDLHDWAFGNEQTHDLDHCIQ